MHRVSIVEDDISWQASLSEWIAKGDTDLGSTFEKVPRFSKVFFHFSSIIPLPHSFPLGTTPLAAFLLFVERIDLQRQLETVQVVAERNILGLHKSKRYE
jgi:hypothetical protein